MIIYEVLTMKKIISVLLSIMMVVAVGAVSVIPAMAAPITVGSGDSSSTINGTVNGSNSNLVTITPSVTVPNQFTFEYTGNDTLKDWEIKGLNSNEYTIISKSGNKLVIEVAESAANKDFTVNAVTEAKGNGSTDTSKPSKDNTDKGSTSPSTGAAMAGVAVAGAGIAVLALRKKND